MESEKWQSIPTPSLEDVTTRARQKFIKTKTYAPTLPTHLLHGRLREGYDFIQAAWDTVDSLVQEGVDIDELFGRIKRETTTSPDDTDWAALNGLETWDEILQHLVKEIILKEMPNKYPELVEENNKRMRLCKVLPPSR